MFLNPNPLRTPLLVVCAISGLLAGCSKPAPAPPAMQALPVQVATVVLTGVASNDTYVSTIKSRRSSTMQPQVDGNLTRILVKSGDLVKAGQLLMQIDPLKQTAAVESQQGTESQKRAVFQYNQTEAERQRKLFEAGVISRDAYDQAVQALGNSKGDYEANVALTKSQQQQLAYYQIRAPFSGVVGDIPVHLGDYVSPTTVLTTVDENSGLEAYIYVPTERTSLLRANLPVDLLDTANQLLAHTTISFISPQVDNGLQGILAKAEIPRASERLRNGQLVNARITWKTIQVPLIPILAVTRIGGQTFVYVVAPNPKGQGSVAHQVAVTLGDSIGNDYPVLTGLKVGDKVITSSIQFLGEGAPVQPLPEGPPPAPKPAA